MAHHVEPMDIDSDFDNKENSLHHNNVLPFTEKGYEELDVSELNMKLRYSVTPASSPMSKSYTANCLDNRNLEPADDSANITASENGNLTRSLNSTLTKNDVKSPKALPLQALPTEQFIDSRNSSVLRPLDTTISPDNANVTVTVSGPSDIDENLSLPSSSSSALQTPEATTPTKDLPKTDGGSPIMRGLKTVFNMFRSSQSPIPPADTESHVKPDILSPAEPIHPDNASTIAVTASTPISAHRQKETSPSKRNSPYKDSIVFNDDLEKELQWKDETTIIFSQERIPIHKLFFQPPQTDNKLKEAEIDPDLNSTVEYMDISYNDSIRDKTITDIKASDITGAIESDSEFLDCETTFTKNDSQILDNDEKPAALDLDTTVNKETTNVSASRLKQIILNTTQDILDATLSITPEDLMPEAEYSQKEMSRLTTLTENNDVNVTTEINLESKPDNITATEQSIAQESKQVVEQTEIVKPVVTSEGIANTNENENSLVSQPIPNDVVETTNILGQQEALKEVLNDTKTFETSMAANNTFTEQQNATFNQQNLDQTHTISNSSINIETNSDRNNTIENISVAQQLFDQTVNITSPLVNAEHPEITKTDDEVLVNQQILDRTIETLNSSENFEVKKDDTNISRTADNIPLTSSLNEQANCVTPTNQSEQKEDHIILEANSLVPQEINKDVITENQIVLNQTLDQPNTSVNIEGNQVNTTIDNHSPETNIPVSQPIVLNENPIINETIVNEDKICEESLAKTDFGEKLLESNVHETVALIKEDISSNTANDAVIVPCPGPFIDGSETTSLKNVSVTELPVDVPLPDEDDLDKEFNMSIDIPSEYNATPTSLPLDLVGDIKKPTETESASAEEAVKITENELNVPLNADKLDIAQIEIKPEDIEVKLPEVSANAQNVINDVLSENNATPSNMVQQNMNEFKLPADMEVLDGTVIVEKPNDTINIEQCVNITQNEVPMNIDESMSEYKPLPDIINQTIPSVENVEEIVQVTLSIPEQVETKPENVTYTEDEVPIPEVAATVNELTELQADRGIPEIVESMKDVTNVTTELPSSVVDDISSLNSGIDKTNISETIVSGSNMAVETQQNIIDEVPIVDAINKTDDDEIVASENNSPFVSVIAEDVLPETDPIQNVDIENIENPFTTTSKVVNTPPASPPITSKGYNFNFDDLDLMDPFATKTKIRMSPPLDTPNKRIEAKVSTKSEQKPIAKKEMINRRKSQPERRKSGASKRKFNSSFDNTANVKTASSVSVEKVSGNVKLESPPNIALSHQNVIINEDKSAEKSPDVPEEVLPVINEGKAKETEVKGESKTAETVVPVPVENTKVTIANEANTFCEVKTTSSSELSTYYSAAGSSSNDSFTSRNVFNLPEIDDRNFNPFATKSKVCQSPPPSIDIENPFATKSKIMSSPETSMVCPKNNDIDGNTKVSFEDKTDCETMEKDVMTNTSSTTTSSKTTDGTNVTFKEVNTEDEDTVEGPFLDSEDIHSDDKISEFDGENIDMMQFNDLPARRNEENLDTGEMFIDAEAFEFLLNQNKSNTVVDSGKESLFLKFDPLFAKRMSAVTSDGVVAALNKIQKKQSTPNKAPRSSPKEEQSPIPGPSNLNVTQDMNISEELNDELNVTVSKPMMVVPPAVNPVTPRNKSLTPNRSNRRSITFTSPAMAVIDRLLSLSGNTSLMHDTTVTQQPSRQQNEADLALTQLRELLAEKEIHVYNLRTESKELKDRLCTLETHLKSLETESQDRLKKINDLNDRLVEKTKINKSMAAVVEEYERTIASLISETAQDKKRNAEERIKLINERDEQTAHLASMEVSFSDLHSKYEKSKQVILNCKANEETYKKSIKDFEENLVKMQNNYELLKQHATSKLNHANQELEKMNRAHEAEVLKLNAMIKRKELHITSLEESLAQKTKANEELTAICDELINKVG